MRHCGARGADKEEEANAADPPYLAALLAAHPGLTKEKALEMIKAFGG
jgi:hypothetical protein